MANERMTNKKAISYVLEHCELPTEITEKFRTMLESLNNKNSSADRKPTAKQIENDGLRGVILNYLVESGESLTCTELGKRIPELDGFNNQRISALVRSLVESGKVEKITEKGKSIFKAVERD